VKPLTPQELEAQLRAIGAQRYHRLHPFHALLHGGKCSKGQVQAWALNRYYYQAMIPVKDASLMPATRFAVEAYVHFVRDKTMLEAVASSLTELFSPQIISERLEGMLKGYDFVSADTLAYFAKRPPLAQRDSDFALDYVKRHAKTPDVQQAVLKALEFKCDVLWAMLDALYHAYVAPKHIPPGAFVPEDGRRSG